MEYYILYLNGDFYGGGSLDYMFELIRDYITFHSNEVDFRIKRLY